MKLFNCESKEELSLKKTDLTTLTNTELINLTMNIKSDFDNWRLKDGKIVVDALTQIIYELNSRM